MSRTPDKPNFPINPEPFGNWFKSFNQLLNEPPVKGFLESIDDFFSQPMFNKVSFPVSVQDQVDKHIVIAELPGIRKEQIGINILGNRLTISVKTQDIFTEEDDKNKIYRRSESIQQLNRTIVLPDPIDEKRVQASYKDGLLKIIIPREKGKTIRINE